MSQYFLPTVIQTNFSDTKNVLTKKHQSNIQTYDDCLRVSKTLKTSKKTPEEMARILDKMRKKKLECKKQNRYRFWILFLNRTLLNPVIYVKHLHYQEKSVHSKLCVVIIAKNIE
jgi:hypothetical protein